MLIFEIIGGFSFYCFSEKVRAMSGIEGAEGPAE